MSTCVKNQVVVIPDTFRDYKSSGKADKPTVYRKGKFLGKGGFAKCFEVTRDGCSTGLFACKIVPKTLLVKASQREKMAQEISIHKQLNHKHIVGFISDFEDDQNVYIILELCRRRSLMELHRRRRAVTEIEARYFLNQLVVACIYLHENKVIHRDLKLGNIFLNDQMEVKIGDFGLATKLDWMGERKRTLCGTPNYIAPEILAKRGHSFEVDVWSLGCILYTLLVGKPPFETASLKETYSKIKRGDYNFPVRIEVSSEARQLVERMLDLVPEKRPNMTEILRDDFFKGYIPEQLPVSCLTCAPRFDFINLPAPQRRNPLVPISQNNNVPGRPLEVGAVHVPGEPDKPRNDYHLEDLVRQVGRVVAEKPHLKYPKDAQGLADDAEDPASVPIYWIAKWVDYSDKYGLGYQLNDNSVGVLYNDSSRMIQSVGDNLQYIERGGAESLYSMSNYPNTLKKKVTLLRYFSAYMQEHLLMAGQNMVPRIVDAMVRLPFLKTWFRTRSAIILHLSNGTVQVNFFTDHTKLIICPLMGAVTVIDRDRSFNTYKLDAIGQTGCNEFLFQRLQYAKSMIDRLHASRSGGTGSGNVQ